MIHERPVKPDVIDATDAATSLIAFDNITPLSTELNTDLCVEKWTFSDTSVSCVLVKGTLTRKFKTTDPWNVAGKPAASKQDLDLDYVIYSVSTMFGDVATGTPLYQFTAANVNYDTFNEISTGAIYS